MRRRLLPLSLLTAAVLVVAAALPSLAAAQSRTNILVGIGDQSSSMFDSPAWKDLRLKRTRYFIRWNAIDTQGELDAADRFVDAARANRVKVLMHISSDTLVRKQGRLPSVRQYRSKVGALVRRYRAKGVRDWGTWNEANHDTQPTWRSPRRAAQFFVEMRRLCRGCTIVALDVLDQAGVGRYIDRWFRALSSSNRRRATIVGIHNYSDTNRYRQRGRTKGKGTKEIIDEVRDHNSRTKFWLTETGGVVNFGRSFRCDPADPASAERRAARSVTDMFSLARRYRRHVTRLYAYNWFGTDCQTRFDAGLVRTNGTTRPGYASFRRALRSFKR